MPEMKNAAASWRVPLTGVPMSSTRSSRLTTTCTLPAHVFLSGEQAVVCPAFAGRGDEPGDQDTLAPGLLQALVDLGAGDPAQDRL